MENSSGFSHAQTWQAGMNDDASRPARLRTGSTAPRFGAIRSQLLSHAVAVNALSTHFADLCSTWSCCLHHKWLNTQSSRSSPVACCNIQLEIHTFWDVLGFHGSSLRKSTRSPHVTTDPQRSKVSKIRGVHPVPTSRHRARTVTTQSTQALLQFTTFTRQV